MKRLRRTILSFVIVLLTYTVYTFTLLPWIEPQYSEASHKTSGVGTGFSEPRQREWMKLFAKGAWELDSKTKSLESDSGVLLFQDYSRNRQGRWELSPATLIYYAANGKGKDRRPFLIRPRKAVLQFDGPLNLIAGGKGKLVGGRLVGDLVITSPESSAGEGDDFHLQTRNVEIEATRIWTPHPVTFRFGRHSGRGQNLTIRLMPKGGKKEQGLSLGQVKSIELTQLDHLTIYTDETIIPSAARLPRGRPRRTARKQQIPVVVKCAGPFKFDMSEYVATLVKNVHLDREYAPQRFDYLDCQKLSLYFDTAHKRRQAARTAKAKKWPGGSGKNPIQWAVSKIVAIGTPTQLLAPSVSASFFGDHLEYHPIDKRVFLKSAREAVRIQYGQHFCSAPQILYQTPDFQRLGTLRAFGPGIFRSSGSDLKVSVSAKWAKELTLRRHKDHHVLSVHAKADVKLDAVNHITAKQLHVWLSEVVRPQSQSRKAGSPRRKKKYDIRVDRFLALEDVVLNSPQLNGRTGQLEGWIRHDLTFVDQPQNGSLSGGKVGSGMNPSKDKTPQSRWDAQAGLIRVQLAQNAAPRKQDVRLESLILHDKVILQEIQTPRPDDEPVVLQGDWLRMIDGLSSNPQFIVSAQQNQSQAVVKARGVHVFARRIDVAQGTNSLWIDGGGSLTAPVNSDLNGNKLAKPERMRVRWNRRMEFNGLVASFHDAVTVTGPQQVLRGNQLDVELNQKINFQQKLARARLKTRGGANETGRRRGKKLRVEIRKLKFHGQVQAESHSYDKQGRLGSVDQMWVRDLELHRDTGVIKGLGPGRMITRHRPSARQRQRTNLLASGSRPDPNRLNYLQVDFRSHLSGNFHERRITLHQGIETLYGPIATWRDQLHNRTAAGLGERGVEIRSNQLIVNEWKKDPRQKRGPLEVTALGNANIRGTNFSAQAARLSYVEAKELVVLEGGNDKAKIRHWTPGGGDTRQVSGRKILFWPKRGEWKLENLGSFTLEGPGTFKLKVPK